jgi:hypothetical protein
MCKITEIFRWFISDFHAYLSIPVAWDFSMHPFRADCSILPFFTLSTATTVQDAQKLVEAGFEYVCEFNEVKIFRRRK